MEVFGHKYQHVERQVCLGLCVCVCVCVCVRACVYSSMTPLTEKLQVCHRHFPFQVPALSDEPIRIHAWNCVNGDELEEREKQRMDLGVI